MYVFDGCRRDGICYGSQWGRVIVYVFFFQAEDGIRDLVRSRGLGDVYKRQAFALLQHSPGTQPLLCRFAQSLLHHAYILQQ